MERQNHVNARSGPPLVSVVFPSHNRKADVAFTLDRLAAEDFPAIETIVVDNGSTDGTAAFVRERYPGVRVLALPANVGAEARNAGLRVARGEFVLMLDSDSHPLPGAIARMVRRFADDPALGAAAFRVIGPDERGSDETGGSHNVFIGCGCGFRLAALRAVGGYPPGYGFYVEEYDVSYRLLAAGYGVGWFADLVVVHRRSDVGRDFSLILRQLIRNNLYLYIHYFPGADAWRTLAWQAYRYWRIAVGHRAVRGFVSGLAAGAVRAAFALAHRRRLPDAVLERTVPDRFCRARIAEIARTLRPGARVVLWGIGKDFSAVLSGARAAGLDVLGVHGANARGFEGFRRLMGIKVLTEKELRGLDADAVLIASASPGQTRGMLAESAERMPGVPIVPLFPYPEADGGDAPRATLRRGGAIDDAVSAAHA
jgi:GT2 family glycosyltransferase